MDIISALRSKEDLIAGKGVEDDIINRAEKKLSIKFALDYRKYLSNFGLAMFGGHEITGLGKDKRTNVVDVTLSERERNSETNVLYVIEQTNIDSIVIWQSSKGTIYKTIGSSKPSKIFNSLIEYIEH